MLASFLLYSLSCGSDTTQPTKDAGWDLRRDKGVDVVPERDTLSDVKDMQQMDTNTADISMVILPVDMESDAPDDAADAGDRPSDCGNLPYSPLVCDGFESATIGRIIGDIAFIEEDAVAGDAFMRVTRPKTMTDFAIDVTQYDFVQDASVLHVRWFQRQPAFNAGRSDQQLSTLQIRSSNGPSYFQFRTSLPDRSQFFTGGFVSDNIRARGVKFPTDTWQCVEIKIVFGDGDASIAGSLNGEPFFSETNRTIVNQFQSLSLGLISYNIQTDLDYAIDFDELIVATGSQLDGAGLTQIGCGAP